MSAVTVVMRNRKENLKMNSDDGGGLEIIWKKKWKTWTFFWLDLLQNSSCFFSPLLIKCCVGFNLVFNDICEVFFFCFTLFWLWHKNSQLYYIKYWQWAEENLINSVSSGTVPGAETGRELDCFWQHEVCFKPLTSDLKTLNPNHWGWTDQDQETDWCQCCVMDRRKVYILMTLWVVAHLGSPGSALRALRRTTVGRRGSGGLTGQDANGVPLRRSKRGWMWNQFFLLEEYTGTDMQYVGKVTTYNQYNNYTYHTTRGR